MCLQTNPIRGLLFSTSPMVLWSNQNRASQARNDDMAKVQMNTRSRRGLQIQAWESRTKNRALVSDSLSNSQRYKSCLPTSTGMDEWILLSAAPEDERKQTKSHSNTHADFHNHLPLSSDSEKRDSSAKNRQIDEDSPKSCEEVSDLEARDSFPGD